MLYAVNFLAGNQNICKKISSQPKGRGSENQRNLNEALRELFVFGKFFESLLRKKL